MFRRNKYQSYSDEALMAALQKGRHRALEELYLRHSENLRWYFFRMTGQDAELARDMGQDLFVKVAEKAAGFHAGGVFRTWMYSIAHNMCKNLYRHREVRQQAHLDLSLEAPISWSASGLPAQIDEALFRERIDAGLALLDPPRRSAFLLRYREGMSVKEIALIQNCPVGTVKSRLHYAQACLARHLSDLKHELMNDDERIR